MVAGFHAHRLFEPARRHHARIPLRFSEARGNSVDARRRIRPGPALFAGWQADRLRAREAKNCASSIPIQNRKSTWPCPDSSAGIRGPCAPSPGRPTASGSRMRTPANGYAAQIYVVAAARRRSAEADQLSGQYQRQLDSVESGWQIRAVRNRPAHGDAASRAHRSDSAPARSSPKRNSTICSSPKPSARPGARQTPRPSRR